MTAQKLKTILSYDPETGLFTWKHGDEVNVHYRGKPAGSLKKNGYIQISYRYKKYYAQSLAILYTTNRLPQGRVRHINNKRSDNRLVNLLDRQTGYEYE